MNGSLPTRSQVLRACRGEDTDDHPLLRAVRELTALHEHRLSTPHESVCHIDEYRAREVRDIDRWVTVHLPVAHGGAYVHTETLGAILDRLARLTANAYASLAGESDWELWFAWERLAELAVGYEDLITELNAGRRRLPSGC
ncbi:DUF4254 domain-containing protein [Nocardia ninae]|uniref:DUF4254 domain-containing protein n=1 Tax=Nocardia ninae TaxID=356145 RepID=UPI00164A05BE|nr:DUF4254 domain-containing protein [Nocardia ninae]